MKKVKEYEFSRFLQIKESKSKMKNLIYTCLEIQDYLLLKNMNTSQAKAMFKFRVKMAPFGEILGGGAVLCPLCHQLPDGQEESFSCRKVKEIINIQGKYQQIFGWKFTKQIIETVQSI